MEKTAFDWKGSIKSFLTGIGIGLPFAVAIVYLRTGTPPENFENYVKTNPQQAQSIIQSAPPDIIEQAKVMVENNMIQTPSISETNENITQNTNISASAVSDDEIGNFIKQWEGQSFYSYPDADGRSIGYGFFLNNPRSKAQVESIGLNYENLYSGKQPISEENMNKLLAMSLVDSKRTAENFVPNLNSYPRDVQLIIHDMAYNLGPRLLNFKELRKALIQKDFVKASQEMQNSRWFGQVGNRSKSHVDSMKNIK